MLVFTLGYFWGKRNAASEFVDKAINESFEDKVNYSLYSLYNNANQDEEIVIEESSKEPQIQAAHDLQEEKLIATQDAMTAAIKQASDGPSYYAELIGFSTEKSANSFLDKVTSKGYPVKIITKKSINPKGKAITWYQAVTEPLKNKDELIKLTNQIEKAEHLNGTKIITIK